MSYLTVLAFACFLIGLLVFFSRQEAKKAIHLQALKKEAKEVARVQNIINRVDVMPGNSVFERLRHRRP